LKHTFILLLIISLYSCNSNPKWEIINTSGTCTARHECGFVAHKNALYLIGGRGDKPVEKFNVDSETWSPLNHLPLEMNHITPVSFGDAIYIVSGFTGEYPIEQPLQYIYKFNTENDIWETILEIPEDRRRGAAGVTIYNDKIYIVNGIKNGHTSGTTSLFDVYDPINNTWQTLPNSPRKRDHCTSVVLDDKLISLGGRSSDYHEPNNFQAFFKTTSDAVDYFDFKTEKWNSFKAKLPNPAAGGGAVILKGELYYFGGETGNIETNKTMYSFNINTKTWSQKPSLNTGRHGTNATVLNNKIYIAAGSGKQGGNPELTSIEVYK
jgi:N-acetylneuraminic acid mutarotase